MYEQCLQLTEALETALDGIWPSDEFRKRKQQGKTPNKEQVVGETIEESKQIEEQNKSTQQGV